jgi:ribosomal protein L37AE/L43A
MLKAKPIIEAISEGIEVIRIICPFCDFDQLEPDGMVWTCCRCGQQFIQNYKD